LAADLVEDADRGGRRLKARSRGVGSVEVEHGADTAVRADDVRRAAGGDDLVAQVEEERGRGAVERVDRRQIEGQMRPPRRAGETPHVLPRGEAPPEAELAREAQLDAAVLPVDPLDVEPGIVRVGHEPTPAAHASARRMPSLSIFT